MEDENKMLEQRIQQLEEEFNELFPKFEGIEPTIKYINRETGMEITDEQEILKLKLKMKEQFRNKKKLTCKLDLQEKYDRTDKAVKQIRKIRQEIILKKCCNYDPAPPYRL